jgi:hypothetical protein
MGFNNMNIAMKNYQSKLSIITLAVLTSLGAQAGTVTSAFNTGDTLTATQMTEIKNAVNDNDTLVTTNTSGILSNASAIVTNTQSIANLFTGDGSAGDISIDTTNDDWREIFTTPPVDVVPTNFNFVNFTVPLGQNLLVPAGTVIRCTGTFTNDGTITVQTGAFGGFQAFTAAVAGSENVARVPPHPGDSFGPAGFSDIGINNTISLSGGQGGRSIPKSVARSSFDSFRFGGGGGTNGANTSTSKGGGLIKIYCGTIINNGDIVANGGTAGSGDGGGGGGIIVLGATTSIDNNGGLNAPGGNGGPSDNDEAAAGGGGGGIIVMVAPTITNIGTTDVTGGLAGDPITLVTSIGTRQAGNGGGGSGGNGGLGGSLPANSQTSGTPGAGTDGYAIEMIGNPAVMR